MAKDKISFHATISLEHLRLLEVLAEGFRLRWSGEPAGAAPQGTAQRGLDGILERLADGMTRPGSWEAPLVRQLFGDRWTDLMEADPAARTRLRPREYD